MLSAQQELRLYRCQDGIKRTIMCYMGTRLIRCMGVMPTYYISKGVYEMAPQHHLYIRFTVIDYVGSLGCGIEVAETAYAACTVYFLWI